MYQTAIALFALLVFIAWIAYPRDRKKERYIPERIDETHTINGFIQKPKESPVDVAIQEIEKEEVRDEKRSMVGKGNILDMINGYDRCKSRSEAKKNEIIKRNSFRDENGKQIKEDRPELHFRGDINRILKWIASEKQKKDKQFGFERGQKYIQSVDEVLSHVRKQNA